MTLNFFKKSICVLIVTLLVLAVLTFINRSVMQGIMLATVILWGLVCFCVWQASSLKKLFAKMKANAKAKKESRVRRARVIRKHTQPDADDSDDVMLDEYDDDVDETEDEALYAPTAELGMVRIHLCHRISDNLRRAYPNMSWEWADADITDFLLCGGTTRIKTWGTDVYTHADVTLDNHAKLHLAMLIIEPLEELLNRTASMPEDTNPAVSIDVAAWYSAHGSTILHAVIQDINAHGYQELTIRENGDIIHTKSDNTEVVSGTMPAFIPKTVWDKFIALLEVDEMKASIVGDGIQVVW